MLGRYCNFELSLYSIQNNNNNNNNNLNFFYKRENVENYILQASMLGWLQVS